MTTVEPCITWSPVSSIACSSTDQQRWSDAWPGVCTARRVRPPASSSKPVAGALVGLEGLARTEADHRCTGAAGERGGARGVVRMRVGHHDGPHRPERRGGRHDGFGVGGQAGRAGVDHDGVDVTDQIRIGPRTGHQTRVGCGDPPDAGHHLDHPGRGAGRDRGPKSGTAGDHGDVAQRDSDATTAQSPGRGPGAVSGPSRLASMETARTAALKSPRATSPVGSGTGASS